MKPLYDYCQQLAVDIDDASLDKLVSYCQLVAKWNKAYNLIAKNQNIQNHICDCLAVLPYIGSKKLLDIGSGAGFPGIVLAIVLNKVNFTLLDSNIKKIRFLRHAKASLQLNNVSVLRSRVENIGIAKFDGVIARGFTNLENLAAIASSLLEKNGSLYAMLSTMTVTDIDNFTITKVIELVVPTKVNRHLAVLNLN